MKKFQVTAAVLLIVAGVAYLVLTSSQAEGIAYRSVEQIRAGNPGEIVRLTGKVVGAIQKITDERRVEFTVMDADSQTLRVTFTGQVPDTLREGGEAVATGRYNPERSIFVATDLLAKCPSKYQGRYEAGAQADSAGAPPASIPPSSPDTDAAPGDSQPSDAAPSTR